MIGRRLSHYRIEDRLGAGGMGEVYRARDEKLGRDVLAMEKSEKGTGTQPPYWLFRADRGRWESLGHLNLTFPNWSPDGQTFTALDYRTRRVVRWSRASGRFDTVADASDIPLLTSFFAPWMGLAPDGSPLVGRDRSTRDLYVFDWEAP